MIKKQGIEDIKTEMVQCVFFHFVLEDFMYVREDGNNFTDLATMMKLSSCCLFKPTHKYTSLISFFLDMT